MIKLEQEVIVVSLDTINKLFCMDNGADLVALYMFYHKQCKLQETNQSWSISTFCMKGLKRGEVRFKKAKNTLKELGLIEDVKKHGKDGKVEKRYIKINYIKSQTPPPPETTGVVDTQGGLGETNALSINNINALSTKKKCLKNIKENNSEFEELRKLYPHARPGKKTEALENRKSNGLDYEETKRQILYMRIKYKYGIDDPQFAPAMQRRIKGITPLDPVVYESVLKKLLHKYRTQKDKLGLDHEIIQTMQNEMLAIWSFEEIRRVEKILKAETDKGIVLVDDNGGKHIYK